MDRQPPLHRRLSHRAPFESNKGQQPQQRTRPLPQPGNEYSKAPQPHRQAARFQLARGVFKAVRRRLQQAVDVLLWDYEYAQRPLVFRLNQAARRLGSSLRSDLQLLQQRLRSPLTREKFFTAVRLSKLSLALALMAAGSGARKATQQLHGLINRLRMYLGQANQTQQLRGPINRLRAIPGQIKQTLQRLGKKLRKD
jgi:hypothetical protein